MAAEHHRIILNGVGERSTGAGDVSPALIAQRAEEIALSDGRTADEVTDADYARAADELIRPAPPEAESAEPDDGFRRADIASATPGRKAANPYEAEGNIGAELVEQGIQEAVHDDFVQSGKETVAEGAEDEPASGPLPEPSRRTEAERRAGSGPGFKPGT